MALLPSASFALGFDSLNYNGAGVFGQNNTDVFGRGTGSDRFDYILENEFIRAGCATDTVLSPKAGIYLQDKISGEETYLLLNYTNFNITNCEWGAGGQPNASSLGIINFKTGQGAFSIELYANTQGFRFLMTGAGTGANNTVVFQPSNKKLNESSPTINFTDVYMASGAYDLDFSGLVNTVFDNTRVTQDDPLPNSGTVYLLKTINITNTIGGNTIRLDEIGARYAVEGTVTLPSGVYTTRPSAKVEATYYYRFKYQNASLGPLVDVATQSFAVSCNTEICDQETGCQYTCAGDAAAETCDTDGRAINVFPNATMAPQEGVEVQFLAKAVTTTTGTGTTATFTNLCTENNKVTHTSTIVNTLKTIASMRYPYAGAILNGLGFAFYFYDADGSGAGDPETNDFIQIKNGEIKFNNQRAAGTGNVEDSRGYVLLSGNFDRYRADRKAPIFDWAGTGGTTPASSESPHLGNSSMYEYLGRVDLAGSDKNTIAMILGTEPASASGTVQTTPVKYGPPDINDDILAAFSDPLRIAANETYNVEYIPRYYYDESADSAFLKNYSLLVFWGTHLDNLINPCVRPCDVTETETTEDFQEDEPHNFSATMENNIRAALATGIGAIGANAGARGILGVGNRSGMISALCDECSTRTLNTIVVTSRYFSGNRKDNTTSFSGNGTDANLPGATNYHESRETTFYTANTDTANIQDLGCFQSIESTFITEVTGQGEDHSRIANYSFTNRNPITCPGPGAGGSFATTDIPAIASKTSITYNGSKHYTRIIGFGNILREGDASNGRPTLINSNALSQLAAFATYAKKKPTPSIDVGFTSGTTYRPLNAVQDINATVYDKNRAAARLIDTLKNLSSTNVSILSDATNGGFRISLSGSNTSGDAIFNATNSTGKVHQITLHTWESVPGGSSVRYQLSVDGKKYYNVTPEFTVDARSLNGTVDFDDTSVATADPLNSTLRVRVVLNRPSGNSPEVYETYVDYTYRGKPIQSLPAKFWSFLAAAGTYIRHDLSETHASDSSGKILHPSASLGSTAGIYGLSARFSDNRTFNNSIYDDSFDSVGYTIEEILFGLEFSNQWKSNILLSAPGLTRLLGNETLALHMDAANEETPDYTKTQDSSGQANHGIISDSLDRTVVMRMGERIAIYQWNGTFLQHKANQSFSNFYTFGTLDIDQDGDIEIPTFSSGPDDVYRYDGSIFREAIYNFGSLLSDDSLSFGDIDLDGKQDVLISNFVTVHALSWDGSTYTRINRSFPSSDFNGVKTKGAEDFDGDGRAELVAVGDDFFGGPINNLTILRYNGTGFDLPYNKPFGTSSNNGLTPTFLYDMDLDGTKDIVFLTGERFIIASWNGTDVVTKSNVSSSCYEGDAGFISGTGLVDVACVTMDRNISLYSWNNATQTLILRDTMQVLSHNVTMAKIGSVTGRGVSNIVAIGSWNATTQDFLLGTLTYSGTLNMSRTLVGPGCCAPTVISLPKDLSRPALVQSTMNSSYRFDGTNDRIGISNATLLGLENISVSFWMQRTAVTQTNETVLISQNVFPGCDFKIWLDASSHLNVQTVSGADCSSVKTITAPVFIDTTKIHAAYVGTNSTMQIYIDGALAVSKPIDGRTKTGSKTLIGSGLSGIVLSQGFNGTIDEFRIYNRSLAEDDVRSLMHFPYFASKPIYRPGDQYIVTVRPYYRFANKNLTAADLVNINASVYEHYKNNDTYIQELNTSGQAMILNGTKNADGSATFVFNSRSTQESNPASAGKRMILAKAHDVQGIASNPLEGENTTDAFRVPLAIRNTTLYEYFLGTSASASIFNRAENLSIETFFYNPNRANQVVDYAGISLLNFTTARMGDEMYDPVHRSIAVHTRTAQDMVGTYNIFSTATEDGVSGYSGDGLSEYGNVTVTTNITPFVNSIPARYFNRGDAFNVTLSFFNTRGQRYLSFDTVEINFTYADLVQWTESAYKRWLNNALGYRIPFNVTKSTGNLTNFQVFLGSVNTQSLVSAGKLRSDCGDFRLIENETGNEVPFWIYGCNTTSTQVWAKIPSIIGPGEHDYHLHYGSVEYTRANDFDAVFQKLAADANTGLILHLDEGSGTTTADSSNNGNTGTRGNGAASTMPSWMSQDGGRFDSKTDVGFSSGSGLRFDGADDVLTVGNSASINGTNSFTMGLWANITSGTTIKTRPLPLNTTLFMLFDSEDHNAPSSGFTRDRSSFGNNGTLYNVTQVSGRYKQAYQFTNFTNRSASYLSVEPAASLDLSNNFTISAWVNGTGSPRRSWNLFTSAGAADVATDMLFGKYANGTLYLFVQNSTVGETNNGALIRLFANGTSAYKRSVEHGFKPDMAVTNDSMYVLSSGHKAGIAATMHLYPYHLNGTRKGGAGDFGSGHVIDEGSNIADDITDIFIDHFNNTLYIVHTEGSAANKDIYVGKIVLNSTNGQYDLADYTETKVYDTANAVTPESIIVADQRVYVLFREGSDLRLGNLSTDLTGFQSRVVTTQTQLSSASFQTVGDKVYYGLTAGATLRIGSSNLDGSSFTDRTVASSSTFYSVKIATDGSIIYWAALRSTTGTSPGELRHGEVLASSSFPNLGSSTNIITSDAQLMGLFVDGSKVLYPFIVQSPSVNTLNVSARGGNIVSKGSHYGIGISENRTLEGFINSGDAGSYVGSNNTFGGGVNATLSRGYSHVALVANGTHLLLYVNGTLNGTSSFSGDAVNSSSPLMIGQGFVGTIDDLKIVNRSLSADEVRQLSEYYVPFLGNIVDKSAYGLLYNESSGQLFGWVGNETQNTSVTFPQNIWQHIGYTYDGQRARIYLNGSERTNTLLDAPFNNSYYGLLFGGNGGLKGELDEIRLRNIASPAGYLKADAERRSYNESEPTSTQHPEQRQILVNGTGHVTLETTVPLTAIDTYASTTANNSLEILDYTIRAMVLNNTGDAVNALDVDADYYLLSDRILFPVVMRADMNRVNATFVGVRNLTVRDGTNASVQWYSPLVSLIYSGYRNTTSGIMENFDQSLADNDSVGTWQIKYTIDGVAQENYGNAIGVPDYRLYEIPWSVGSTGTALTNYTVNLTINNATIISHMQANGKDVRVLNHSESYPYPYLSNVTGKLPYWIESISSTQLILWVKVDSIPASGGKTIYLYYGNPTAQAESNATKAYEAYDATAKKCTATSASDACTFNLPDNDVGVYLKAVVTPTCGSSCSQFVFMGNSTVSPGSSETGNVVYTGFHNASGFANCHGSTCWDTSLFSYVRDTSYTLEYFVPRPGNARFNITKDSSTSFLNLDDAKESSTLGVVKSVWFRTSNTAQDRYEVPITLSSTGTALTGYQTKVVITNTTILSHMQANGKDIRVFNNTETAPYTAAVGKLPYWIESISPSELVLWTKVDSIPATGGKTIYLYYGNATATAETNGQTTFDFFDDFNDDSINTSKWDSFYAGGCGGGCGASERNGAMEISAGDGQGRKRLPSLGTFANGIMESKGKIVSFTSVPHIAVLVRTQANNDNIQHIIRGGGLNDTYVHDNGQINTTNYGSLSSNTGKYYFMRTSFNGTNVTIFNNNTVNADSITLYTTVTTTSAGPVALSAHDAGTVAAYDDVRVRQYASPEPSATIGTEAFLGGEGNGYTVQDVFVRKYVFPEPAVTNGTEGSAYTTTPSPGGTFTLNNTIGASNLAVNLPGEIDTQEKIFNLGETINISGRLLHADGGPLRRKVLNQTVVITETNYSNLTYRGFYELPINVSNTRTETLTNYSVFLNITNQTVLAHMRTDANDLRFFNRSVTNPYTNDAGKFPYWVENKTSSQAFVWVNMPSLAASSNTTVYMYYGTPSAVTAESNGSTTFLFFDDFNGTTLDLSKWYLVSGTVHLFNGSAYFSSGATIHSRYNVTGNATYEIKGAFNATTERLGTQLHSPDAESFLFLAGVAGGAGQQTQLRWNTRNPGYGSEVLLGTGATNVPYIWRHNKTMSGTTSSASGRIFFSNYTSVGASNPTPRSLSFDGFNATILTYGDFGLGDVFKVDWARIRMSQAREPVAFPGNETNVTAGGVFPVNVTTYIGTNNTAPRPVTLQIFNTTYGQDILERSNITVDNSTGYFELALPVNSSLVDTYLSLFANQAEAREYGIRFYDGTNNTTSNVLGNDGNQTNNFDIDANYYFSNDTVLFPVVMRGDTQRSLTSFVNGRNVTVPATTNISVRWYDSSNTLKYAGFRTMLQTFDQSLANDDSIGTWTLKYLVQSNDSLNINNSLAEASGGTFILNNTIRGTNIVVDLSGASPRNSTQRKIFNLGETINVSGTLFHPDGGPFRIKAPTVNTSRTLFLQLFNNTYGIEYLTNPLSWQAHSAIDTGLGDIGSSSAPSVFLSGGTLYLISGEGDGGFFGFNYTGSAWQQYSGITSGLGVLSSIASAPSVFQVGNTLYLVSGKLSGGFTGFNFTNNQWIQDSNITTGLPTTSFVFSTPSVFQVGSTLYLVSGNATNGFLGFNFTNNQWIQDSNITTGLPTTSFSFSAPAVFLNNGTLYLIAGNESGSFTGFNFTNNQWVQDSQLITGLSSVSSFSKPNILEYNGQTYLISGQGGGNFAGHIRAIVVNQTTGFFNGLFNVTSSLNDTYQSTTANQSEALDYDIRFYDGTTSISSNAAGNDGNATNQFDADYGYYPVASRTDGFDLYNRGETVNLRCISYGTRNNTIPGSSTFFRAYDPVNAIWLNDGQLFVSNGAGLSSHSFVLNRSSMTGSGWQSYCNTTKDGNSGNAKETGTFTVSNAVNATLYVNDANLTAYNNPDFNTGIDLDAVYAYVQVRNSRGELTTQFDNLSVENWFRHPYTLATNFRFNNSLVASSAGNYSNVSFLAAYQNQTHNATFTVVSNDTYGNTNVTGMNLVFGKLHYLTVDIQENDTHILRTQSIGHTFRAFDTFTDLADNGIIDASSGLVSQAVSYVVSVFTDDSHSSAEFSYSLQGSSQTTQGQLYGPAAARNFRDVRVVANASAIGLDGVTWNFINRTAEPSLNDLNGAFSVDDLVVSAITFDRIIYRPPQVVNALVKYAYYLANFTNTAVGSEFYAFLNASLREPDNETSHTGTYYNATFAQLSQTDANGNATFSFALHAQAEAGKRWIANASTLSDEKNNTFDVQLMVNQSNYFAHRNSEINNSLVQSVYHNRNETVQANFTFANNPEGKAIAGPVRLYDTNDSSYLNSSGKVVGTQGAEFVWTWPSSALAANTLAGTSHVLDIQALLNSLDTNATPDTPPQVSSLLLLDMHAQGNNTVLFKDDDPTVDGNNLRDNQSLKNVNETTIYVIGNSVVYAWAHVQNIRGENLNVSVNSTLVNWTNPDSAPVASFNLTANNYSWSEFYSLATTNPPGYWTLLGNVSFMGNFGNDTQLLFLGNLKETPLVTRCSQRASITGVLCTISANIRGGRGLAPGQIMQYRVRNESYEIVSSGLATDLENGAYAFSFVPQAKGTYYAYGYVDLGQLRVFSDAVPVYSDLLNITTDQALALNYTRENVTTLNTTVSAQENFGGNSLGSIRMQLEELRRTLLILREESKENDILVTDSVVEVNELIARSERGDVDPLELRAEMQRIQRRVIENTSSNGTSVLELVSVESLGRVQYWVIALLAVVLLGLFMRYRRLRKGLRASRIQFP